jgi:hypothetical protein
MSPGSVARPASAVSSASRHRVGVQWPGAGDRDLRRSGIKSPRQLVHGSRAGPNRELSPTRSASSSDRPASFAAPGPLSKAPVFLLPKLGDRLEITPGKLSIGTMHLAKASEFRVGGHGVL